MNTFYFTQFSFTCITCTLENDFFFFFSKYQRINEITYGKSRNHKVHIHNPFIRNFTSQQPSTYVCSISFFKLKFIMRLKFVPHTFEILKLLESNLGTYKTENSNFSTALVTDHRNPISWLQLRFLLFTTCDLSKRLNRISKLFPCFFQIITSWLLHHCFFLSWLLIRKRCWFEPE